jgi:hypothetical protein
MYVLFLCFSFGGASALRSCVFSTLFARKSHDQYATFLSHTHRLTLVDVDAAASGLRKATDLDTTATPFDFDDVKVCSGSITHVRFGHACSLLSIVTFINCDFAAPFDFDGVKVCSGASRTFLI